MLNSSAVFSGQVHPPHAIAPTDFQLFNIFQEATTFEKAAMGVVTAMAVIGLLYALFLIFQIRKEPEGTDRMKHVAGAIRTGANAYLKRQFRTIAFVIALLAVFMYYTATQDWKLDTFSTSDKVIIGLGRAFGFLMGAAFSAMVGWIGMNMAVRGNVRVAQAARSSFTKALKIAYRTGTITGMLTDGLGLLGGVLIFMLYGRQSPEVLLGFGFGGTLLALFMRVGGGIYTKAADVGADLVGKVEKNIPEDDPRNAAVIADQVGDNVGDCAGMAADIFESYEVTIVSTLILGILIMRGMDAGGGIATDVNEHFAKTPMLAWIIFPLLVRASGVFSSIISTYSVRALHEGESAMKAIHRGYMLAAGMSILFFFLLAQFYFENLRVFWATSVGVLLAISINYLTDYFTSTARAPVKEIAKSTQTGPATTILSGLGFGLESAVWAIIAIAISILLSAIIFSGLDMIFIFYGVALCGIGQLTLTGNNVAMDSFGPVCDNANGIGEMSKLEPEARQHLADLDAVGNTTKAITKGIAIASAVIAAVSLFAVFYFDAQEYFRTQGVAAINFAIDLINYKTFIAFLIGGSIPFLFSSQLIRAVGRAAFHCVNEVRYQFKIPGVWEGTKDPDYGKVVDICTKAAQRELITPVLMAIITPLAVGFLLGLQALGGFLAGVILSGQLMAVFMSNAGGAWDNAKKTIEDGQYGGKGSEAHKASVVGDTVGDPLKDTAGPALNPLIKVINIISVIATSIILEQRGITDKVGNVGTVFIVLVAVGLAIVFGAIWFSRSQSSYGRESEEEEVKEEAKPS